MSAKKPLKSVRDIRLHKRYAAELRYKAYGFCALVFSLGMLAVMLGFILMRGYNAFWQTKVTLPVFFDSSVILKQKNPSFVNYNKLVIHALQLSLQKNPAQNFPLRELKGFISDAAGLELQHMVTKNPSLMGKTVDVTLLVSSHIDSAFKGLVDLSLPTNRRKISDLQIKWMQQLAEEGRLEKKFNSGFFLYGGSSRPETSGISVALKGSFYLLCVVFALALPVGVAAAIYLEEFCFRGKLFDMIEITINNLAAVPSIIFGILGLAVFINFMGLPRSSALVGGLTLSLMTLPVIIVATRASLSAVPSSVRLAALALGASKVQMVFHHVVPLSTQGIVTGSIIGLARTLGETAPLLVIGMVAFVADPPETPLDPSTALPVQIYLWSNQAERAFSERMFGVVIVLVIILMIMNIIAIFLRNHFRRI